MLFILSKRGLKILFYFLLINLIFIKMKEEDLITIFKLLGLGIRQKNYLFIVKAYNMLNKYFKDHEIRFDED